MKQGAEELYEKLANGFANTQQTLNGISSLFVSNRDENIVLSRQFNQLEEKINADMDFFSQIIEQRRTELLQTVKQERMKYEEFKRERDEGLKTSWIKISSVAEKVKNLLAEIPRIPSLRTMFQNESGSKKSESGIESKEQSRAWRGGAEVYQIWKYGPDLKKELAELPTNDSIQKYNRPVSFTRFSVIHDDKKLAADILKTIGALENVENAPVSQQLYIKGSDGQTVALNLTP